MKVEPPRFEKRDKFPGDHSGGATPVPIPNTEVKPASADGTWGVAPWESRTSPGVFQEDPCLLGVRGTGLFAPWRTYNFLGFSGP